MRLAELLGVDIPIVQAPMAGVQNWELAVTTLYTVERAEVLIDVSYMKVVI